MFLLLRRNRPTSRLPLGRKRQAHPVADSTIFQDKTLLLLRIVLTSHKQAPKVLRNSSSCANTQLYTTVDGCQVSRRKNFQVVRALPLPPLQPALQEQRAHLLTSFTESLVIRASEGR